MATRRPRQPRRPCPHCGQQVAVSRATERMQPHGPADDRCSGSGRRIDLYGDNR